MIDEKTAFRVLATLHSATFFALSLFGCEPSQKVAEVFVRRGTDTGDNAPGEDSDDHKESPFATETTEDETDDDVGDADSADDDLDESDGDQDSRDNGDDDNHEPPPNEATCGSAVYGDSIVIENQEQWDELDLRGITWVKGSVIIQKTEFSNDLNIIDVDNLRSLRCIEGDLTINNLPELAHLNDMPFLGFIGGNLNITRNGSLVNLGSLFNVWSFGSKRDSARFYIAYNPSLDTCHAYRLWETITPFGWDGEVCITENWAESYCDDVVWGCDDL